MSIRRALILVLTLSLAPAIRAPAEYVDLRTWVITDSDGQMTNGFYGAAADMTNGPAGVSTSSEGARAASEGAFDLLRVHARVLAGNGLGGPGHAYAYGEWADQITIIPDDASLSGQYAYVDADIVFSGEVKTEADDSGSTAVVGYSFDVSLGASGYGPRFGQWDSGGTFSGFPLTGATNFTFAINFGEPLQVHCSVSAWADASGGAGENARADADINLARSAQSVVLKTIHGPSGPVTNYTVASSSGISWREPYLAPPVALSGLSASNGAVALSMDNLVIGFTNTIESCSDVSGTNWVPVADCSWVSGQTTVVVQVGATNAVIFRVRQD